MSINITHTMSSFQFENQENLRDTARDILSRKNNSDKSIQKIIDKTIFDNNFQIYSPAQLAILKASAQISMNGKLKETLKYLKSNPSKKQTKEPVLGELWNLFSSNDTTDFDELEDIEIDFSNDNIFKAA